MKVLLHEQTIRQLDAVKSTGSGSFIFHGGQGVGKAYAARELARQLNCLGDDSGPCKACLQLEAGAYPDLIIVRPEDKPSILIEQIRNLAQVVSLSLYHPAGSRVVIIDDAQMLTIDAQNALLKLIEEPPARSLFILVTDQPESLLPTVRSRCANVYFATLPNEQVAELLISTLNVKPSEAAALATVADGAPGTAVMLASSPSEAASRQRLAELASSVLEKSIFARLLLAKQLIDEKLDLQRFGLVLHRNVIEATKDGSESNDTASRRLQAIETFRSALLAKVAPKVVVERLMLEL